MVIWKYCVKKGFVVVEVDVVVVVVVKCIRDLRSPLVGFVCQSRGHLPG